MNDLWESFSVSLFPCIRADGNCKPQEELSELSFLVSFPTPITNFGDLQSPVKYVNDASEFIGVSNIFNVLNYHSLRVNDVLQERGFLSSLEVTHKFVSTDKFSTTITARDPNLVSCPVFDPKLCTPYISHIFTLTNNKLSIQRSYKGVVESVSEVGGMIDLIYLVFALVYNIYHGSAVDRFFVKELYGIDAPPSKLVRLCKRKNSQGRAADSSQLYEQAISRLHKDLDLVGLLEELNTLRFFVLKHTDWSLDSSSKSDKFRALEASELGQKLQPSDSAPGPFDEALASNRPNPGRAKEPKLSKSPIFPARDLGAKEAPPQTRGRPTRLPGDEAAGEPGRRVEEPSYRSARSRGISEAS